MEDYVALTLSHECKYLEAAEKHVAVGAAGMARVANIADAVQMLHLRETHGDIFVSSPAPRASLYCQVRQSCTDILSQAARTCLGNLHRMHRGRIAYLARVHEDLRAGGDDDRGPK
jgi:hypothetical protein